MRAYLGSKSFALEWRASRVRLHVHPVGTTRVPGCGCRNRFRLQTSLFEQGVTVPKPFPSSRFPSSVPTPLMSKPAVSSGFSHGASRTRTDDLLGAIYAYAFATGFHS